MDTQLLNISKEELSLKIKLVEQLEKSEEEVNSGMNCGDYSFNHQSVPQYRHPTQINVQYENQGNEKNERVCETYHDLTYFNFQ